MSLGVQISKQLILVNSVSAVLARLLKLTVLAWLYQYLLKRVSPDEFAVYALVMAIMVFAPLLSTVFTSGISRYIVEACARGDEKRVRQILSSIVPVLTMWSLVLLVLGGVFTWQVDRFLNIPAAHLADARLMLGLLLVDFAIGMVLTPYHAGFHARQRFVLLNTLQIAGELFRIGLLFSMMLGINASVLWVVVASVTANTSVAVACAVISVRLLPSLRLDLGLFQFRIANELVSFGMWSMISHLAYLIYINADIIVLNKLATALDVSNYKLGSEFYVQIQALVSAAIATILPALTAMHACGDVDRLRDSYLRGCRYCLWVSMFVACPLIVNSRELIRLYVGETYLGAASVMILLLLLLPFTQTIGLLASLATAKARLREFSLTSLGSQLIKLAVTIYFVRNLQLGASGCALSTLIIIGVAVIAVFWPLGAKLAQVTGTRFAAEVLWRGLLPGAIAIAAGWFLHQFHQPATWFALAGHALVCCLVFAGVLVSFCLGRDERAWISQARKWLPLAVAAK